MSRYAIQRQARARSWASASSRPIAVMRSGPVGPSATNIARAMGCAAVARTWSQATSSAASARVTCSTVGRRAAVPKVKWTSAATPQPRTIAATTSAGSARPRYIVAIASRSTIPCPTRRVGRARYGDETVITATAIEMRTNGKRGTSVRSKVTENVCARSVFWTNPETRRPRTHASAPAAATSCARRQRRTRTSAKATRASAHSASRS